jgi:hypothetical protein
MSPRYRSSRAGLQRRGEWLDAAELYRRATELDLLTEAFHRNLMCVTASLAATRKPLTSTAAAGKTCR